VENTRELSQAGFQEFLDRRILFGLRAVPHRESSNEISDRYAPDPPECNLKTAFQ